MLIAGGLVYDHDGDTDRPAQADILTDGNRIAVVGPGLRVLHPNAPVVDARDHLVLPGFINAHYHSHDTLLKGFFEGVPVELWSVLALPPSFPRRSRRELRARTLIGAVECLHGGITTVQDMDHVHPFDPADVDAVLEAYDKVGIRCIFAPHVTERSPLETTAFWRDCIPEAEQWRSSGPAGPLFPPGTDIAASLGAFIAPRRKRWPRITFGLGPSSPDRLRPATIAALADLSRREALPFYIHLNESPGAAMQGRQHLSAHGGSPIQLLHDCGALGPRTSLAHSVWLTDAEIELIGNAGATTALCPVGNLKTRSGVARIGALFARGIDVGLGCDNCSCSDAQNMLQAMRMTCSLATLGTPVPGRPYAADVLRAACTGGAKPAGLEGELGALRPGMLADMVLLDLSDPVFRALQQRGPPSGLRRSRPGCAHRDRRWPGGAAGRPHHHGRLGSATRRDRRTDGGTGAERGRGFSPHRADPRRDSTSDPSSMGHAGERRVGLGGRIPCLRWSSSRTTCSLPRIALARVCCYSTTRL